MAHATPVQYAIHVFGSQRKLADAAGLADQSWVSHWKKKGLVPSSVQAQILSVARQQGLPLTADDLIFGREVANVPAR